MPTPSPDWAAADGVLRSFVSQGAFPGAVSMVGDASGVLHTAAVGAHTYADAAPPMELHTPFDIASLTKVSTTTTCAMLLYQWGVLRLGLRVVDVFGPAFADADRRKAQMTEISSVI